MADTTHWILTDVAANIWRESFHITSDDLSWAAPAEWAITKQTLRGGLRDGVDAIEVNNGALSFTVLPTRGMGLWRGAYRGLPLGWQAPVRGPVHPQFVNLLDRGGLGWLHGFDEWVCRCGLHSNGPPGEDPATKEFLTLLGRIANLPAHFVEVGVNPNPPHELTVRGQVDETCLFFTRLRLTATITTTPGANRLTITDEVENLRSAPAELELLYHCQFGPPFLGAGSRVRAPVRAVAPRNERAAEGMAAYDTYLGPTPGYTEQVYFYDLLADPAGRTLALLHDVQAQRGVVVRMTKAELPHFIVWKHTAAESDGYMTGLEPATNFPNFKALERERGRVLVLPPQGRYRCSVTLEVHDTPAGVAEALREIEAIQGSTEPTIHPAPRLDW